MDYLQDHPTSWTALEKQRYIDMPIHCHHPGKYSNFRPVQHSEPYPRTMKFKDENAPPTYATALSADISASTADPVVVPPRSLSPPLNESLISPGAEGNLWPTVLHPLNPAQVPLPHIVATSDGSDTALSGRTGLSIRASRSQQARDNLIHIVSVAYLSDIPPLVEAVSGRLSSIT